jgi:hypothetical protein
MSADLRRLDKSRIAVTGQPQRQLGLYRLREIRTSVGLPLPLAIATLSPRQNLRSFSIRSTMMSLRF